MEREKIIIIHNQISPYRLPIFEEINKRYEVKVLFCEPRAPDRLWKIDLINRYRFKWKVLRGKRRGRIILNDPIEVAKELKGTDIVIVSENVENIPTVILTLIISKLTGKQVVIWTERIESPWIKKKFNGVSGQLKRLYERLLFRFADAIAAYSKTSRRYVMKIGARLGKLFEGLQIVPEEVYPTKKSELPVILQRVKRRILYLGYMRPEKGVEYLVKAFKRMDTPDTALILAGTGPLLETIKEDTRGNIILMGYVSEEMKASLYEAADVFVIPTLHDPWALVINEALYYGTPVVATTAAAGSQIIEEGKTGFIIKPGDEGEMYNILEQLTTNPKEIRKMKRIIRRIGRKYSLAYIGARHLMKALERLQR